MYSEGLVNSSEVLFGPREFRLYSYEVGGDVLTG